MKAVTGFKSSSSRISIHGAQPFSRLAVQEAVANADNLRPLNLGVDGALRKRVRAATRANGSPLQKATASH